MLASASMAAGCSRTHKPLMSSSQPSRSSLVGVRQSPALSGTQLLRRCQPLARRKSSVRCWSSLPQHASQLIHSQLGQGSSSSEAHHLQRSRLLCRARQRGREEPAEVEYINPPPGEGKLESRLPEKLRQQVEDAVESLGGRVTVGDVSARAGVKVSEAEQALNALAADCLGSIQVSEAGDVLYVLPSNFKNIIRGRSWMLRAMPLLTRVKEAGAYLVRVGFGAALLTSVALVWITIMAIMTSSGSDRDDRNRGYSSGYTSRRSSFIFFDASDLLWFSSPRRPPRYNHAPDQQMSFLESIFSFVFGDGDPNLNYEEQRWRTVGRFIQSKGGVVTAEELAPFLDPPERNQDDVVDEDFVVPALVRFGGSPEVDERGNLVYRFESLQRSAGNGAAVQAPMEPAALQNLWEFSKASGGQRFGAIALGAANLVGVAVLGGFLQRPDVFTSLAQSSLGFMINLFPFLQAYAASFFVIPAIRWVLNQQRNLSLQTANRLRLDRLAQLRNPDSQLQAKLASARAQAKRTVIRDRDIIYRSDKQLDNNLDSADFDRRLAELDNQGPSLDYQGRSLGDWGIPQPQEVQPDSEWGRQRG